MSIGLSTDSPPLEKAIQELYKEGMIMVASAGNSCAATPGRRTRAVETNVMEGRSLLAIPPSSIRPPTHEVIAVGATNNLDQTADYSLSGGVDVRPRRFEDEGSRILSTTTGGYGYWQRDQSSGRACHRGRRPGLAARPGALLCRMCVDLSAGNAVKATSGRENRQCLYMVQALLAGQVHDLGKRSCHRRNSRRGARRRNVRCQSRFA